jgi:hypothetical protein
MRNAISVANALPCVGNALSKAPVRFRPLVIRCRKVTGGLDGRMELGYLQRAAPASAPAGFIAGFEYQNLAGSAIKFIAVCRVTFQFLPYNQHRILARS